MNNLISRFSDRIKKDFPLENGFTLKIKTKAEFYIEVDNAEDIVEVFNLAKKDNLPVIVIGGGSNIATFSPEIKGVVVKNRYIKKQIVADKDYYSDLFISSGYPMGLAVKDTISMGLSCFEYHLGLPGTLGGAVCMNSKWTKPVSYIGDNLLSARILSAEGEIKEVNKDYFEFAYDYSKLQDTKEILLDMVFRLKKLDKEILQERSAQALSYRKETQPFGVSTSGCFFQNISDSDMKKNNLKTKSAGYLIDKSGLKGKQIGGFYVSQKHANFIINDGKGTAEDLQILKQEIKDTVFEKFGVSLKEEVKIL